MNKALPSFQLVQFSERVEILFFARERILLVIKCKFRVERFLIC